MIVINDTVTNAAAKRTATRIINFFIGAFLVFIFSIGVWVGSSLPPHFYWPMWNDIRTLYNTEYNGLLPDKIVDGFDIDRDTFHFPNFGSALSKNGNCHAIAYIEKAVFDKNYDVLQGIDVNKKPGDYQLSAEEIKNIYKTDNPDKRFTDLLYPIHYPRTWFWFEYYDIINLKKEEPEEYLEDTEVLEQNNETAFEAITTMQNELNSPSKVDYYEDYLSINNKNNLNLVIELLDKNNLLIMTVTNRKYGHAVLAYGYKKVSESEYLIYVADNNVPVLDVNKTYTHKNEPVPKERVIETNNQIKGNMYVLVKLQGNKTFFKYNPVINKCYIYSNTGYNSYIPDSELRFYW